MVETMLIGYLAVGALCGVLLWLAQRSERLTGPELEDDGVPPLAVVLLLAGLAWPIALPLVAWGWLRELTHRRTARRRSRSPGGG
jgi:hypothetical protein